MLKDSQRHRFILPTAEWRRAMSERLRHLAHEGVDAVAIFQYAVLACSYTPMHEIEIHLSHDLRDHFSLADYDLNSYQRLRHACLDAIGELAALLIPQIETYVGTCDHSLKFERFLGQDVVVSICVDIETRQVLR